MINIILIVGLPGSGKSELSKMINRDNDNKYHIIDDPKNFDTDIKPYLDRNLIITDPALCFEQNRESAIKYITSLVSDVKIDWIFFENDPESCLLNSKNRNIKLVREGKPQRKVSAFIKNLNRFYTIPKGSNVISVYKNNI